MAFLLRCGRAEWPLVSEEFHDQGRIGVVINRVGIGDDRAHVYCRQEGIPILLEIREERQIAEAFSRGKLILEVLLKYRGLSVSLIEETMNLRNAGASGSAGEPS
jgi:MinD superfamily P-loop ATPase